MRAHLTASALLWGILGCTDPVGPVAVGPVGQGTAPGTELGAGIEGAGDVDVDPLLARARAAMVGGRVPASIRAELLASADPGHRRAARLLQTIAGEAPSPLLPWPAAGEAKLAEPTEPAEAKPTEPAEAKPTEPTEAKPTEPTEPTDAGPREPDPAPVAEAERPELAALPEDQGRPKLDDFVPGSAVRHWFEGSPVDEEEEDGEDGDDGEDGEAPPLDLWLAIVGEDPLLARLPPPPALDQPSALAPHRDPSLARGLVILTRLELRREGDTAELTVSGAGPVEIHQRTLASQRLLLWIDGAGAMPNFTAARPRGDELAVVDVRRDEGRVEIEVELAAGWTLGERRSLSNGARVQFVRTP